MLSTLILTWNDRLKWIYHLFFPLGVIHLSESSCWKPIYLTNKNKSFYFHKNYPVCEKLNQSPHFIKFHAKKEEEEDQGNIQQTSEWMQVKWINWTKGISWSLYCKWWNKMWINIYLISPLNSFERINFGFYFNQ